MSNICQLKSQCPWDSLGGPFAKTLCSQGRGPEFNPWVGNIPWRKEQLPTPVLWPEEFQGQRSLASYSPWGRKESDTTEKLSLSHHLPLLPCYSLLSLFCISTSKYFHQWSLLPTREIFPLRCKLGLT